MFGYDYNWFSSNFKHKTSAELERLIADKFECLFFWLKKSWIYSSDPENLVKLVCCVCAYIYIGITTRETSSLIDYFLAWLFEDCNVKLKNGTNYKLGCISFSCGDWIILLKTGRFSCCCCIISYAVLSLSNFDPLVLPWPLKGFWVRTRNWIDGQY